MTIITRARSPGLLGSSSIGRAREIAGVDYLILIFFKFVYFMYDIISAFSLSILYIHYCNGMQLILNKGRSLLRKVL